MYILKKIQLFLLTVVLFLSFVLPVNPGAADAAGQGPETASQSDRDEMYEPFEPVVTTASEGDRRRSVLLILEEGNSHSSIYNEEWRGFSQLANHLQVNDYIIEEKALPQITLDELWNYDAVVFFSNSRAHISDSEVRTVHNYVRQGGGLWILGEMSSEGGFPYNEPLNEIAKPFGIEIEKGLLFQEEQRAEGFSHSRMNGRGLPLFTDIQEHVTMSGVNEFYYNWGTALDVSPPAVPVAFSEEDAWLDPATTWYEETWSSGEGWYSEQNDSHLSGKMPVAAVSEFGRGKVAVLGDSGIFANVSFDDNDHRQLTLNTLEWLMDTERGREVTVETLYPVTQYTPSTVMKGGSAVRYYQLFDDLGVPVRRVNIQYRFEGQEEVRMAETNEQGMFAVETDPLFESNLQRVKFENVQYQWPEDTATFPVQVRDREFNQTFSLSTEMSGQVGVGAPSLKVGNLVEINTVSAALKLGAGSSTMLNYENIGEVYNLKLEQRVNNEIGVGGEAGLRASILSGENTPTMKAGAGIESNASGSVSHGYSATFDSFNDRDGERYNQQLMESFLFMLNAAVVNNSRNAVGAIVYNYLLDNVDLEGEYSQTGGYGGAASAGGSVEIGVDFPFTENVSAATMFESNIGVDMTYDKQVEHHFNSDEVKHSVVRGLAGSYNIGKIKNQIDTSPVNLNLERSDSNVYSDGIHEETGLSLTKRGSVIEDLTWHSTVQTSSENGFVTGHDSFLKKTNVYPSGELTTLKDNVPAIHGFLDNHRISLSSLDRIQGEAMNFADHYEWQISEKEEESVNLGLELAISVGPKVGLGASFSGADEIEYTRDVGVFESGLGEIVLERYDDDTYIDGQRQDVTNLLDEYAYAVGDAVSHLFDSTVQALADGAEYVWESGKATVKSVGSGIASTARGVLTTVTDAASGFSFFSAQTATGQAPIISEIYLYHLIDEDGDELENYGEVELSLEYEQSKVDQYGYQDQTDEFAIYHWNEEKGYYVPLESEVDTDENMVTAVVTEPGQYLVAVDVWDPVINDLTLSNIGDETYLETEIGTRISQIDLDFVNLDVNGADVSLAEGDNLFYQPVTGALQAEIRDHLEPGENEVSLSVTSGTGKSATKEAVLVHDTEPPVIHDSSFMVEGDDITVEAEVTDNIEMSRVLLNVTDTRDPMNSLVLTMDEHDGGIFRTTLNRDDIAVPEVSLIVKARDWMENEAVTDAVSQTTGEVEAVELRSPATVRGVDPNGPLTLSFNELIDSGERYDQIEVVDVNGEQVSIYVQLSGNEMLIYPSRSFEEEETYTLLLPEESLRTVYADEVLHEEIRVQFTTGSRETAFENPFSDFDPDHRAGFAVYPLVDYGVIQGYPDGTFRPDANILRGEAALMLARGMGLVDQTGQAAEGTDFETPFADVPDSSRYYDSVNMLKEEGITSGYADGSYRVSDTITRAEMAVIIANAFSFEQESADFVFTDRGASTQESVQALYDAGITEGIGDDRFGSDNPIKRSDFSVFVHRSMDQTGYLE
ncbi:S-layer homology domain-containing protein [Salisediminibacterium selenitireducens]|uniref:S-layer domain protein n=1 Tax=Bacillus selenitireducens (strain ATCC 700615 / DSM 15326 / MLS10) TaxID=439292 RepID=D6XZI6_BACIE|nr:S-layer homology domain-containing protein [Salisediminibacterium selenitireducens]ADH98360.1 S-layer domain protein [[Bacillus] selenitireducens MLS10]